MHFHFHQFKRISLLNDWCFVEKIINNVLELTITAELFENVVAREASLA